MAISDQLEDLNLISGDKLKAIFDQLYPDALTSSLGKPSEYMTDMWSRYTNSTPSLNGKVFEGLLACVL